jgi:predicted TIM-barrel fold metal-dependent hydrolase
MRQKLSRRSIVQFLAASVGASVTRLGSAAWSDSAPSRPQLVDAHCHVFNATDLPARRFLKIVIAERYPTQGVARTLDLDRQDAIDHLIDLMMSIVGQGHAPSAAAEIAVLEGTNSAISRHESPDAADPFTARATAAYLDQTPDGQGRGSARSVAPADPIRSAIRRAGGTADRGRSAEESRDSQAIAERAVKSPTDIGAYLRWFGLFTLYRYSLVDALVGIYSDQGYVPVLLAPAIIDYSRWLGQEASSALDDQVRLMSLIARRKRGPAVHGYMGFDPLREVYFRKGILKDGALGLVRSALTEHGFAGVKLYPPMGFRASGNASDQQYPQAVLDDLGPDLSSGLNSALHDLYALCTTLDAPILVHTAETNGAGPNYADRADPAYWLPVLSEFPALRVCLAHFGRFSYVSARAPLSAQLPESSWEWVIGRYLKAHPDCRVYVDLSYLTEIFDNADARERLGATFRRFVAEFDPEVRHVIFGSDWIMVAQDSRAARYVDALTLFLGTQCKLESAAISRILRDNALTFLGLRAADATRARLLEFYQTYSILDRLPTL